MGRAIAGVVFVWVLSCSTSGSPPVAEQSGDDAAGGEAGMPPPDVDGGTVPPPAATCTAPITAADTSAPTTVIGTGTAASCTEAALAPALAAGGIVTFDCGAAPATITVTATISLPTDRDTVVDGGGKITIDGGGAVRILDWNHADYRKNTHTLTLQHVAFAHGRAKGTQPYAAAPAPCSTGFYDGAGGALNMRDGTLHVIDATFLDDQAEGVGATIALFGGDGTILNCTFASNACDAANMFGAAIFGSPSLAIENSIFDANTAQNPGAPMQCQVGAITGSGDMQWPKNHANGGGADAPCAPGIYEDADPMLGTLGDNGGPVPTVVPGIGSPALGRGAGCPTTDARGMPRSTASCTAGAVEGSK